MRIDASLNEEARKAEEVLERFASSAQGDPGVARLATELASDISVLLDDVETMHAAPPPVRPVAKVLRQFMMISLEQLVRIVCSSQPSGKQPRAPKTPPILASIAALIMKELHFPEPLAVGAAAYVLMVITYSFRAGFCGVAQEQLKAALEKLPTK
jgi:hypothetical protein